MTDIRLDSQPPTAAAPSRLLALVTPAGIARLPLWLVIGYLFTTFGLFLLWPINWPIYGADRWFVLIGYVLLALTTLSVCAILGSAGSTRVVAPFVAHRTVIMTGAAAATLLLAPSTLAYTSRWPWQFLEALRDQGLAYRDLQEQLVATGGQRGLISAARALAAPLVFAVLPLGILHWRTLGWPLRGMVAAAILCSITFSVMRGTDKEFADIFIVGLATAMVSFGRHNMLGQKGFALLRLYWKQALIAAIFVYIAAGLFTTRKDERLGGYDNRTMVCANDSRICADLDSPLISWMPLRQRFGATFFILSTCSGYYGLNLALEKPFESTYGIGHSPAVSSVYEMVTGDTQTAKRAFTYRNRLDGWSDENYWSTLITWVANDVGFPGTVVVLGLLGFLWGLWWREASAGLSDPAAILFALSTMMMFYLPANNQVLASYDGYFVFGVWIAIWLWHRARRALSVSIPA